MKYDHDLTNNHIEQKGRMTLVLPFTFLETLAEKSLRLTKVYSAYQCILNITTLIAKNRISNFLMTTLLVVLSHLHLMSAFSFRTQNFVNS